MAANVEHEQLWRTVFRDAGVAMALVDRDGRLFMVNAALGAMLGYDEAELLAMTVADLAQPDDRAAGEAAIRRLTAGDGERCQMEERYRRKDGTAVWGRLTASLARDADGRPAFVIATIENIDRSKQADAERAALEARLRAVLDAMPAFVSEIDAEQRHVLVNRAYETAFGRGRHEIEGRPMRAVLGEEIYRRVADRVPAVLSGQPVTSEDALDLGRGPRTFRVSYIPNVGADGRVASFFVFGLDDTERADAERQRRDATARLEEQTRMLDAVLSAAADSISMFDREGRYLYASRRVARSLGVDQTDLVGRRLREVELPAAVVERIDGNRSRVMATGQAAAAEIDVPTSYGVRRFEYTLSPVKDRDGAVVAVVATGRDMTERKQAEDRIRQSLTEKEALLREVHHRVKNNMQIIVSLLNLQSQGFAQPELRKSHDELGNRIRALALVHQMLTEGSSLARLDLADYVARLCEELRRFYLVGGRRVALQLSLDPVALDMDRAVPFGLILNELVSNCFTHGFPDDRPGTATVALTVQDGTAELSVADNGVGMAAPAAGAGLGLRLVQALAAQIGGEVTFEPLAPGTRASVRWPIDRA